MHNKIVTFLNKHNVINKYQFGFRKQYSTTYALIEITENIYNWLDDGYCVAGIFLDLQKAFDTVDRQILIEKLQYYGLRGKISNWLNSYLSDRKQFTCIGNCKSSIKNIDMGVPQGSILGPLLFNLYVNDIGNSVSDPKPRLFADDTNVFLYDRHIVNLKLKCNDVMSKISEWIKVNKLSINISKTSYTYLQLMIKLIQTNLKL
jgi:retron-type reverse transcriptase